MISTYVASSRDRRGESICPARLKSRSIAAAVSGFPKTNLATCESHRDVSLSPPFSPGSASTAMHFATNPLGRPLDLPLPFGALSPCCACIGAVQSIILEPSAGRNPDKSIWMLPLLFPLLAESALKMQPGMLKTMMMDHRMLGEARSNRFRSCLLYTSDAADD